MTLWGDSRPPAGVITPDRIEATGCTVLPLAQEQSQLASRTTVRIYTYYTCMRFIKTHCAHLTSVTRAVPKLHLSIRGSSSAAKLPLFLVITRCLMLQASMAPALRHPVHKTQGADFWHFGYGVLDHNGSSFSGRKLHPSHCEGRVRILSRDACRQVRLPRFSLRS